MKEALKIFNKTDYIKKKDIIDAASYLDLNFTSAQVDFMIMKLFEQSDDATKMKSDNLFEIFVLKQEENNEKGSKTTDQLITNSINSMKKNELNVKKQNLKAVSMTSDNESENKSNVIINKTEQDNNKSQKRNNESNNTNNLQKHTSRNLSMSTTKEADDKFVALPISDAEFIYADNDTSKIEHIQDINQLNSSNQLLEVGGISSHKNFISLSNDDMKIEGASKSKIENKSKSYYNKNFIFS